MKFKNPLLVVKDMDVSVEFYKNVLGLHKIMDFGANVTLTGGVCLQTLDTWKEFIGTEEIIFGARDTELYFEEDDFDKFLENWSHWTWIMSILSASTAGDSGSCAFMIRTVM